MKVYLTGGLGNQLFQLSAALSSYDGEIRLVQDLGRPRKNSDGNPEIESFELPSRVVFTTSPKRGVFISQKLIGINLRSNVATKKYEPLLLRPYRWAANVFLSLMSRELVFVRVANGVGFSRAKRANKRSFLVGYFQSYRYLSENAELLPLIQKNPTPLFTQLVAEYKSYDLAIHLRVGDYKNEPLIGILGKEYYVNALKALNLKSNPTVVVFTDSPEEVPNYLPIEILTDVKIAPTNLSSAETLVLMSTFDKLIIGNSTFSWWAASSGQSARKKVIVAPSPWFIGQENPIDLIPPSWIQVQR